MAHKTVREVRRLHIAWSRNPRLPTAEPRTWKDRFERLLVENVVPFWTTRCIDPGGGYHERIGAPASPSPGKHTRTQARTLWYFSRLLRSAYSRPEHAASAEHGFAFLAGHLWDGNRGGMRPSESDSDMRHAYDQVMALDALAEYYGATDATEARRLAEDVLDIIMSRFRDGRDGYWEGLTAGWRVPDEPGLLVDDPTTKTTSTHVNLLHCFANVHAAGLADLATPIREVASLLDTRAVLHGRYMMGETFVRDWSRSVGPPSVSYGHDLERIWMAGRARHLIGDPVPSYADLFDEVTRWGWDRGRGGFFFSGPPGRPARLLAKRWWVQAEGLVACAHLSRLDGGSRDGYVEGTLRWIETCQADWETGEWHDTVTMRGSHAGLKAWEWKTGYHTARSLLMALELVGD